MGDQSGLESSNFSVLFESALEEYERETGNPLAQHPLAELLERCNSLESVSDVLQEQTGAFDKSINSRITKSLNSIVSILYTLSTTGAIGNAIKAHFPPATLLLTALAILLGVCAFLHFLLERLWTRVRVGDRQSIAQGVLQDTPFVFTVQVCYFDFRGFTKLARGVPEQRGSIIL